MQVIGDKKIFFYLGIGLLLVAVLESLFSVRSLMTWTNAVLGFYMISAHLIYRNGYTYSSYFKNLPFGMRILVIYAAWGAFRALLYLSETFTFQENLVFLMSKTFFYLNGAVGLIAALAFFYLLIVRKGWQVLIGILIYRLIMFFQFTYTMFNLTLEEAQIMIPNQTLTAQVWELSKYLVMIPTGIGLLILIVILVYLIKRKDYFFQAQVQPTKKK